MNNSDTTAATPKPEYEPPQIEQILTAEQLTREVHYAGVETEAAG